jgi:acyl-CoA thioesterase-1
MTSLKAFRFLLFLWMSGSLWAANGPVTNSGGKSSDAARGRIVVLGDSITAGYGLDPAQAYPAILQQKIDAAGLPFSVVNAGLSGDTTAGGLRRVDWSLGAGADVLIIALGGNDGLRGLSPKETEANLLGIIKKARTKSPGISVIIAGMQMPENMGKEFVEKFSAVFPRVAKEAGVALVPFLLEGVGGVPELNQADMIHPTPEGQKRVAENVWKILEKVLAERAPSK